MMQPKHFRIVNSKVAHNAAEFVKSLPLEPVMEVTIKPWKKKRSVQQNKLYWMWMGIISEEVGHSSEEMHELFASKLLPLESKEVCGEVVNIRKSTTKLSVKEFTEYLLKVEAFASEFLQTVLPHPEDLYYDAIRPAEKVRTAA